MSALHLIELAAVDSTNDHAKMLARQGAESGTVILAHEQRVGRGRQGNRWVSPPGNLFMSMILRPAVPPAQLGQLSFVAAVALADAVLALAPTADLRLKWPNDLLINGKKISGILIEAEGAGRAAPGWVVVGIGMNIMAAPDAGACLHDLGVTEIAARDMAGRIGTALLRRLSEWETQGFSGIRDAWLRRAHALGGMITARLPQKTLTGVFEGLDDDGALQLKLPDGRVERIASGEVFAL